MDHGCGAPAQQPVGAAVDPRRARADQHPGDDGADRPVRGEERESRQQAERAQDWVAADEGGSLRLLRSGAAGVSRCHDLQPTKLQRTRMGRCPVIEIPPSVTTTSRKRLAARHDPPQRIRSSGSLGGHADGVVPSCHGTGGATHACGQCARTRPRSLVTGSALRAIGSSGLQSLSRAANRRVSG